MEPGGRSIRPLLWPTVGSCLLGSSQTLCRRPHDAKTSPGAACPSRRATFKLPLFSCVIIASTRYLSNNFSFSIVKFISSSWASALPSDAYHFQLSLPYLSLLLFQKIHSSTSLRLRITSGSSHTLSSVRVLNQYDLRLEPGGRSIRPLLWPHGSSCLLWLLPGALLVARMMPKHFPTWSCMYRPSTPPHASSPLVRHNLHASQGLARTL